MTEHGALRTCIADQAGFGVSIGCGHPSRCLSQVMDQVEFCLDAFSTLNNPACFVGDHAFESVNFGRIASNFTAPRQLQFGLYYRF